MKEKIKTIFDENPHKLIISKPSHNTPYRRVDVERKGEKYQFSMYTEKQVFHENLSSDMAQEKCIALIDGGFTRVNAFCDTAEFCLMISKKGKATLNRRNINADAKSVTHSDAHDRQKNYILPEGSVPPLIDMGVFTADGRVKAQMYDKYKQINRFIEIIDDAVKQCGRKTLNVIDFGCGKSYLTFVVYYYLTEIRGIKVNMIGLDLKADVIKKCGEAAAKYGYDGLRFEVGDINGFNCPFDVDMVITLHACDTATDHALYNAVKWGADMIFSVPCCQHELNAQITSENLSLLTKYGIIKERFSALATDAIRAGMLEYCGYKTQLLEFIDFEHTPKNILIRAVKAGISPAAKGNALAQVNKLTAEFGLSPTICRLLAGNDEK